MNCQNIQFPYKVSWNFLKKILIASYTTTCTLPIWFKISFPSINLLIIVGFPCSRQEIVLEKRIWEPHSSYTFCHDICSDGCHWDLSNGNMFVSFKILNIHKLGHHDYTFCHDICCNGYHWVLFNGKMLDSFKILNIHKPGYHDNEFPWEKKTCNHVVCIRLFKYIIIRLLVSTFVVSCEGSSN